MTETAAEFLKRRAGNARPKDMLPFFDRARRDIRPIVSDEE